MPTFLQTPLCLDLNLCLYLYLYCIFVAIAGRDFCAHSISGEKSYSGPCRLFWEYFCSAATLVKSRDIPRQRSEVCRRWTSTKTLLFFILLLSYFSLPTFLHVFLPTYLPQPERERDPSKGVICVGGDSKQDISLIDSESRLSCVYSSVCGIFVC